MHIFGMEYHHKRRKYYQKQNRNDRYGIPRFTAFSRHGPHNRAQKAYVYQNHRNKQNGSYDIARVVYSNFRCVFEKYTAQHKRNAHKHTEHVCITYKKKNLFAECVGRGEHKNKQRRGDGAYKCRAVIRGTVAEYCI